MNKQTRRGPRLRQRRLQSGWREFKALHTDGELHLGDQVTKVVKEQKSERPSSSGAQLGICLGWDL